MRLNSIHWKLTYFIESLSRDELEEPDNIVGAGVTTVDGLHTLQLTMYIGDWNWNIQARTGHVEDHLVLGLWELEVLGVSTVGNLQLRCLKKCLKISSYSEKSFKTTL